MRYVSNHDFIRNFANIDLFEENITRVASLRFFASKTILYRQKQTVGPLSAGLEQGRLKWVAMTPLI